MPWPGVVGPLIEVLTLLALVYLSLWFRRRLFTGPISMITILFDCVHSVD